STVTRGSVPAAAPVSLIAGPKVGAAIALTAPDISHARHTAPNAAQVLRPFQSISEPPVRRIRPRIVRRLAPRGAVRLHSSHSHPQRGTIDPCAFSWSRT